VKSKLIILTISLLILSVLLPACTSKTTTPGTTVVTGVISGTTNTSTTTTASKTTTPTTPTTATTSALSATEPQYGGTLTLIHQGSLYPPTTWDPADFSYLTELWGCFVQEEMVDGDLSYGPRGTNQYAFNNMTSVPAKFTTGTLAESWVVKDSNTIIIKLRQGIYWQAKSGVMSAREMTADDVVYSWTRQLTSPKVNVARYKPFIGVVKVDKYTVQINLAYFEANYMWYIMEGYYFPVYPQEMVTAGASNWKNFCGTGPFLLSDYVQGSGATYLKNPNYWRTATIDGKTYNLPFIDKLQMPIINDQATRAAAIRTGKADICQNLPWSFKQTMATVNDIKLFTYPSTDSNKIAMRVDTAPFTDIRVRQAMALAIDKDAVNKACWGGEGLLFNMPCNPGDAEFTPADQLPADSKLVLQYDPDRAIQLLKDAGFPTGFTTTISVQSDAIWSDVITLCASYWAKIGVKVNIQTLDYASLYATWGAKTHPAMTYIGHGQNYPLLTLLAIINPAELNNVAMINNPQWSATLAACSLQTDPSKNVATLKELSQELLAYAAYIPMPVPTVLTYAWPWVKNYYGEYNTGAHRFSRVASELWLDKPLKKKMGY